MVVQLLGRAPPWASLLTLGASAHVSDAHVLCANSSHPALHALVSCYSISSNWEFCCWSDRTWIRPVCFQCWLRKCHYFNCLGFFCFVDSVAVSSWMQCLVTIARGRERGCILLSYILQCCFALKLLCCTSSSANLNFDAFWIRLPCAIFHCSWQSPAVLTLLPALLISSQCKHSPALGERSHSPP